MNNADDLMTRYLLVAGIVGHNPGETDVGKFRGTYAQMQGHNAFAFLEGCIYTCVGPFNHLKLINLIQQSPPGTSLSDISGQVHQIVGSRPPPSATPVPLPTNAASVLPSHRLLKSLALRLANSRGLRIVRGLSSFLQRKRQSCRESHLNRKMQEQIRALRSRQTCSTRDLKQKSDRAAALLKTRIKALETELNAAKRSMREKENSLVQEIRTLKTRLSAAHATRAPAASPPPARSEANKEVSKLRRQVDTLKKSHKNALRDQKRSHKNAVKELQQELKDAKALLVVTQAEADHRATYEVGIVRTEVIEKQKEIDSLRKMAAKTHKNIAIMRAEIEKLNLGDSVRSVALKQEMMKNKELCRKVSTTQELVETMKKSHKKEVRTLNNCIENMENVRLIKDHMQKFMLAYTNFEESKVYQHPFDLHLQDQEPRRRKIYDCVWEISLVLVGCARLCGLVGELTFTPAHAMKTMCDCIDQWPLMTELRKYLVELAAGSRKKTIAMPDTLKESPQDWVFGMFRSPADAFSTAAWVAALLMTHIREICKTTRTVFGGMIEFMNLVDSFAKAMDTFVPEAPLNIMRQYGKNLRDAVQNIHPLEHVD